MALDTRPGAPTEPPPSEAARSPRKPSGILNLGRVDAVDMLSIYFALAFFLPGWLRIPALGEAGRPSTVWGLVLFGWWIATRVAPTLTPRYRQPLHFFVWLYVMAFLAAMTAGYQRGLTPDELTGMDRRVLTFVSAVGVVLVAADGIRTRERMTVLFRRIVLLGIFPAVVGFLQFAVELDLSIKIHVPGLETGPIPWQRSRGDYVRSWGTSLHAIEFGVVMAMLMGIAIHLALYAKSKFEAQMMWILAALFGAVSVFANSRTQMVAIVCVMLPLVAAWCANWRVRAALVGVLAVALMSSLFPGLISGLVDLFVNIGEDESATARSVDYDVVFDQIADSPWFGIGPGANGVTEEEVADSAGLLLDNEWLGTLQHTGIVGVASLALLILAGLGLSRRVYRWGYDEEWRHTAALLFAMVLAGAVTAYLFDSFYYSQYSALFFTALGLAGASYRINREGPLGEPHPPRGVLRVRRTLQWQPYRPELAPPRNPGHLLDGIESVQQRLDEHYDSKLNPGPPSESPNPIVRRRMIGSGPPAPVPIEESRNPFVRLYAVLRR